MRKLVVLTVLAVLGTGSALAQAPPPPEPKIWTVAASAGLALTSGNSRTTSVNAAYDIKYEPLMPARNSIKSDGLFLRTKTESVLSANRLSLNGRDEFKLSTRAFVFGQTQYLRDEFKKIDYLVAPGGGIGYKIFDTMATKLAVDTGAGGVLEKDTGFELRRSGAVTASEKLTQTLTESTTLTQAFTGLWKMKAWDDSLYTFSLGIAAAMSAHTQLKVEALDTLKNRPPLPTVKKNDVAVLMAIVYKI